jgi:S-adenosylmethionine:tRNA ribosyltransferase-isomerase
MRMDELNFDLPAELIATTPAEPRDTARLMVIHRKADRVEHRTVRDLPGYLRAGDLMLFNESRVLPARFEAVRAATKGVVEGLFLSAAGDGQSWRVMLESGGKLREGETLLMREGSKDLATLVLLEKGERGQWRVAVQSELATVELLNRVGTMPLPPYIRQQRKAAGQAQVTQDDAQRYNTVYASTPGSVAAPTAGLHFTPELLRQTDDAGVVRKSVTLHVGLGTFAPVRVEKLEDHAMHSEWVSVPEATIAALRQLGASGITQSSPRRICVGTTTVRAVESLPSPLPEHSDFVTDTNLFITPGSPGSDTSPGFAFRFTDVLMTNFHLPQSTLLALVAALPDVGVKRLLAWYELAVREKYRFYSYGDAMLLLP